MSEAGSPSVESPSSISLGLSGDWGEELLLPQLIKVNVVIINIKIVNIYFILLCEYLQRKASLFLHL